MPSFVPGVTGLVGLRQVVRGTYPGPQIAPVNVAVMQVRVVRMFVAQRWMQDCRGNCESGARSCS
jgi:hypothetical protein